MSQQPRLRAVNPGHLRKAEIPQPATMAFSVQPWKIDHLLQPGGRRFESARLHQKAHVEGLLILPAASKSSFVSQEVSHQPWSPAVASGQQRKQGPELRSNGKSRELPRTSKVAVDFYRRFFYPWADLVPVDGFGCAGRCVPNKVGNNFNRRPVCRRGQ